MGKQMAPYTGRRVLPGLINIMVQTILWWWGDADGRGTGKGEGDVYGVNYLGNRHRHAPTRDDQDRRAVRVCLALTSVVTVHGRF